jgi:O-antigen ligase
MARALGFTKSSERSLQLRAGRALAQRNLSLQKGRSTRGRACNTPHWPVVIFLIGLAVPWIIPLGPLNLSVYRLVLLAFLLPCLWNWVRGTSGRIRPPDIALFFYSIWAGIALFAAHNVSDAVQSSGIFFIETMGAYLLARCFIRNADDFRRMVLVMTMVVIALSPFAVYEWITGSKPILWALSTIFPTVEITTMTPRWGFWRVQGPFSHSIEFGLFCTSILVMTHLVLGRDRSVASRWLLSGSVAGTAFLSMSSAPLTCLVFQVMLIGYNSLLCRYRSRWTIVWSIAFIGLLVVQFGSNQSAIKFFISHFTFDPQTGWYRIAIWDYGSASVLNHPFLGIGLGDWQRPRWMPSDSVDNFWLLTAMRYGIPSAILLFGSCIWMTLAIVRAKSADSSIEICRLAYLMCMTTFMFVGVTIHFAHAVYAWFMFILGSGAWLLEVNQPKAARAIQNNPLTTRRLLSPGMPGSSPGWQN